MTCSALTGAGSEKIMPAVLAAYETWNRRVPTAALNRWLEGAASHHPPPLVAGRRLKLRYITQVKARPPTFALFASKPTALPESYPPLPGERDRRRIWPRRRADPPAAARGQEPLRTRIGWTSRRGPGMRCLLNERPGKPQRARKERRKSIKLQNEANFA